MIFRKFRSAIHWVREIFVKGDTAVIENSQQQPDPRDASVQTVVLTNLLHANFQDIESILGTTSLPAKPVTCVSCPPEWPEHLSGNCLDARALAKAKAEHRKKRGR